MSKYINKLTNEEIESFFNVNGYNLIKDLEDDDGLIIDAIERDDENIFVRAQQIQIDKIDIEFENYLIQKSPNFAALSALISMHSGYGRNIELIHFSDYFLSKFCITPEDKESSEELYNSYIRYMIEKFPTYKNDLIEYYKSLPDNELYNEQTM